MIHRRQSHFLLALLAICSLQSCQHDYITMKDLKVEQFPGMHIPNLEKKTIHYLGSTKKLHYFHIRCENPFFPGIDEGVSVCHLEDIPISPTFKYRTQPPRAMAIGKDGKVIWLNNAKRKRGQATKNDKISETQSILEIGITGTAGIPAIPMAIPPV